MSPTGRKSIGTLRVYDSPQDPASRGSLREQGDSVNMLLPCNIRANILHECLSLAPSLSPTRRHEDPDLAQHFSKDPNGGAQQR